MSQKTFCLTAGLIFLVVAVLHLWMFIFSKSVIVMGQPVPLWSNLIITAVTGYLAYQGLKLRK